MAISSDATMDPVQYARDNFNKNMTQIKDFVPLADVMQNQPITVDCIRNVRVAAGLFTEAYEAAVEKLKFYDFTYAHVYNAS